MKHVLITLLTIGLTALQPLGTPDVRIMLDFIPNPNHVPLYVADQQGYFAEEGISVAITRPSDASDPAKLCAARAVDLALTPQMNLLIAQGAGLPLIAVGALIDGALGGLLALADRGVTSLGDLAGATIGYSLAPLEPVLWRTMLASAGVDPDNTRMIYVRMNTRAALLTGRVDAIGAFRNFEMISVELEGHDVVFFPQEDYGVPNPYELVIIAHPEFVEEEPEITRAFLRALSRGISFTLESPEEAFALFTQRIPELGEELGRRSLEATLPLYAVDARHDDPERWTDMLHYLIEHALVPPTLAPEDLYTTDYLP